MPVSYNAPNITRDSSEDEMVATLLSLKAAQLAGQIEQAFRVQTMHVIWCSQHAGCAEAVSRRVNG